MKSMGTWFGIVVGALTGVIAWGAVFAQADVGTGKRDAFAKAVSGVWMIATLDGRYEWLGFVVFAVAGGIVGAVAVRAFTANSRHAEAAATASASQPHPMD